MRIRGLDPLGASDVFDGTRKVLLSLSAGRSVSVADLDVCIWEAALQLWPDWAQPETDSPAWAELRESAATRARTPPRHKDSPRLLGLALGAPNLVVIVETPDMNEAAADASSRVLEAGSERFGARFEWRVPVRAGDWPGVVRLGGIETDPAPPEGEFNHDSWHRSEVVHVRGDPSSEPRERAMEAPSPRGPADRVERPRNLYAEPLDTEPKDRVPGAPSDGPKVGHLKGTQVGSGLGSGLPRALDPSGPFHQGSRRAEPGWSPKGDWAVRVDPILGRPHPASPGELALHEAVESSPDLKGRFSYNSPVVSVMGSSFVVDLVCPEEGLAVEVDGFRFHSSQVAFSRDRHRDFELLATGWRVLRLTHGEIATHPREALHKIRVALRAPRTPQL